MSVIDAKWELRKDICGCVNNKIDLIFVITVGIFYCHNCCLLLFTRKFMNKLLVFLSLLF